MNIALPVEGENINQHFGRSTKFLIATLENDTVVNKKEISTESLMHQHEGLASFLEKENVSVVITGGIGQGALNALDAKGFKVIRGASGKSDDIIDSFIKGTLKSRNVICNHHGEHHHQHNNNSIL